MQQPATHQKRVFLSVKLNTLYVCGAQCSEDLKSTMGSLWRLLNITTHRAVLGPGEDFGGPFVAVDIAGAADCVLWAEYANATM